MKYLDRLSDFDLLQRLRKRDVASLRELHCRHAGFVKAIALRILGHGEEAAEVVQDVFIHLWTHGFELDEQRARFQSWLFVVARNRAIERRRLLDRGDGVDGRDGGSTRGGGAQSGNASSAFFADAEGAATALGASKLALRDAERSRIHVGMAALTEPERAIIELAFYDGYTHTEMAAKLDAPLEEVKSRLRSAMETLHRLLREKADPDHAPRLVAPTHPDEERGLEPAESLEPWAAAFALGALDGEERSRFEGSLFLGDAALWHRIREFASTTDALVSRIGSQALSAEAFAELEERMTAEGFLRRPQDDELDARFSWKRRVAVVAVLAGAALLGSMLFSLRSDRAELQSALAVSEQGRAELGLELAALKEQISATEFAKRQVEIALESREDALASVMRPSGRDLRLRATSRDLDVTSRAFVDAETNRVWVSIDALPILPSDQTYQLWIFVDDEAVDGAVFVAEEGKAIQVEAAGPPSAVGQLKVAVTIEPAGGSPLPAGPIILSGS